MGKVKAPVAYGSRGDTVTELQRILNGNGYNLKEDGIFGKNTQVAVEDFQNKNGLSVDGVVGNKTWSQLTGYTGKQASTKKAATSKAATSSGFSYKDYTESDTVAQAQAALNAQLAAKPGAYESQWQAQIDDILGRILNRDEFSYDVNGDALYQQYKDNYIQQGKMAMQDTMGQAAAMTGGYGNSYAATAGNQAYQASLSELNDVVPELYQMALDKYTREGDELLDQYALLGDQEDQDYAKYQDAYNQWLAERDNLQGRYDTERDYDYGLYADGRDFAYGKYQDTVAQDQWQTEYDEQVRQYNEQMAFSKQQYADSKAAAAAATAANSSSGSSSSGSSSSGKSTSGKNTSSGGSYNNSGLSASQIKELQKALGVETDGMYGSKTKEAAGGLSAAEAYKKYVGKTATADTGFTGSSYKEAVSYLKSKGVSGSTAAGLMTQSEWQRRKYSSQANGVGTDEVSQLDSYQEYLEYYVEYHTTYGS